MQYNQLVKPCSYFFNRVNLHLKGTEGKYTIVTNYFCCEKGASLDVQVSENTYSDRNSTLELIKSKDFKVTEEFKKLVEEHKSTLNFDNELALTGGG